MGLRARVLDAATDRLTDMWWFQSRVAMPYFVVVGIPSLLNLHPAWNVLPMAVFGGAAYAHMKMVRGVRSGEWQYGECSVAVSGEAVQIEDAANNRTSVSLAEAERLRRGLVDLSTRAGDTLSGDDWQLSRESKGPVRLNGTGDRVTVRSCDVDYVSAELDDIVSENADALLAEALQD